MRFSTIYRKKETKKFLKKIEQQTSLLSNSLLNNVNSICYHVTGAHVLLSKGPVTPNQSGSENGKEQRKHDKPCFLFSRRRD